MKTCRLTDAQVKVLRDAIKRARADICHRGEYGDYTHAEADAMFAKLDDADAALAGQLACNLG